jgi:hypothetical protein
MQEGMIFIIGGLIFYRPAKNANAIVENLYFLIFLCQAFFINSYTFNQVVFQSFCCPLAELGASF